MKVLLISLIATVAFAEAISFVDLVMEEWTSYKVSNHII
jgi:hypothetical protein